MDKPSKRQKDSQYELYFKTCFAGAEQIRKRLKMDEATYKMVAGFALQSPRDYYLYGVLDELEKVGVAILRYEEFLSDEVKPDMHDRIHRNTLKSICDEQDLWKRKLTEILTELILFKSTNTHDYFRHYLLVRFLEFYNKVDQDFKLFYNCTNKNIKHTVDEANRDIKRVESNIDVNKCWYLASKKISVQRKFDSQRGLFLKGFKAATNEQRLVMGFSYQRAVTFPSMGIHATLGSGMGTRIDRSHVTANVHHIGLLATHVLICVKQISRLRFRTGFVATLNRAILRNPDPSKMYKKTVKRKIEKGDIVLAHSDLAEVTGVNTSQFGYKSFSIKYLDTPPIPSIPDDCFASQYVRLLFKRKKLARDVRETIKRYNPIQKLSHVKVAQAIRKTAIEAWHQMGLKEHVHGQKEVSEQKFQEFMEMKKRQYEKRAQKVRNEDLQK